MKTLIALAAALFFPATLQAQSYRSISMGPNAMTFIEEGTLQRYSGMASATFLFVFRTANASGSIAQTANFHISCNTPGNTYSYGNFVYYDAAMKEMSRSDQWKSSTTTPGSVIDAAVQYACKGVLGRGSMVFPHKFAAAGHASSMLNKPKP